MDTCGNNPNMSADSGSLRNRTRPHPGNATADSGHVRFARPVHVTCAVLSLVALGAVLLGLPEFIDRVGGKSLNGNAQPAYQQISAGDVSDSPTHRPSGNTFVSSPSVFDPKLSIDPDQGFFVSALETSHDSAHLLRVQGPGRCWNPHPGPFRSWNGAQNGCLIQVWRQFQDGCTHFQWFNTCYNVWDPQIYWTYCIH